MTRETDCTEEERARTDAVIEKLYGLMMRAHEFDARPRTFGTGMTLSRAEIHTVQAVGHADEMNMTALARSLGVTKGAASQMVARLAAKGLIVRQPSQRSGREVTLALTALGKRGYAAHEKFHRQMAVSFKALFGPGLYGKLDGFSEALDGLKEVIEFHEKRVGERR